MVYQGNNKRKIEYNLCYCRPEFYDGDSCSGCDCEMTCYKAFLKDMRMFTSKESKS